jgi:hypothetical protein
MSGAPDITEGANKPIALLIAVLALLLALSETLGKNADKDALVANVEASNLWAFFQAKTIRQTNIRTAAEEMTVSLAAVTDPVTKAKMTEQVDKWLATAERYESDPKENDGRKELTARAKETEAKRALAVRKGEHFEFSSSALQIAIVVASAAIITGVSALAWLGGVFGLIGVALVALGHYAPHFLWFL